MGDHSDVENCLEYEEFLTAWEFDFLESLLEWDGEFTEKQDEVLERIMAKIDSRLGL